jgi:ketosteroid isomerase-like protein
LLGLEPIALKVNPDIGLREGGAFMKLGTIYKVSIALLSLIICVLWAFQATAEEWSAIQKEIWQMEERAWWAMEQGDIDGYLNIFSEDLIAWPTWTKEPVTKGYIRKNLIRGGVKSSELKPLAVKVFGDTAITMYIYHMVDVTVTTHKVAVTHTWIKRGGTWRVIGSMTANCVRPHLCP